MRWQTEQNIININFLKHYKRHANNKCQKEDFWERRESRDEKAKWFKVHNGMFFYFIFNPSVHIYYHSPHCSPLNYTQIAFETEFFYKFNILWI